MCYFFLFVVGDFGFFFILGVFWVTWSSGSGPLAVKQVPAAKGVCVCMSPCRDAA